jgi:serine/threonine protein kinase
VSLKVGKYKLIRRLAIGGMAEIFLASIQGEAGFERAIIIKKILPKYAHEPEFARRLIDEGLLASRLAHANIVQVLDLGKIGPDYFIAMEYVDGADLREILARSTERDILIPVPIGVHILWQVARALSYAHDKKDEGGHPLSIIHRDISPANILISWEGAVKLGDFGIAKASQRLTHTLTGVLQGKFPYMSPEQTAGADLDQRSDIFSFGSVAYELLTGARPFQAESDFGTMESIRDARFEPIETQRPDLPSHLADIVHTCLNGDKSNRYDNGAGLERALASVLQSKGWVATEGDVAEYLDLIYGEDRFGLHDAAASTPSEALGEVEARPLSPDEYAGIIKPPTTSRSKPEESYTRSVIMPTWQTRRKTRRSVWVAWTVTMALLGAFLVLDYASFHLLLGRQTTQQYDSPLAGQQETHAVVPRDVREHSATDIRAESSDRFVEASQADVVVADSMADVPAKTVDRDWWDGEVSAAIDVVSPEDTKESVRVDLVADSAPEKPDIRHGGRSESGARSEDKVQRPSVTSLRVIPFDAAIFQDGKLLGPQPQAITVPVGSKDIAIRIEKTGYETALFQLRYPSPRKLQKRLIKQALGRLKLRYFPAVARVTIDGKEYTSSDGMNHIFAQLPVGSHEVTVTHEGKSTTKTITIQEDREWAGTVAVEP